MIPHEFKPYADIPDYCVAELPDTGDTCNRTREEHASDICTECGESIAECPVRRQDGMRAGMCGICNDIAAEIECEDCW